MTLIAAVLLVASALAFIFGLKMMSSAATARRGNALSAVGMGLAVLATLIQIIVQQTDDAGFHAESIVVIVVGLLLGTAVGVPAARLVKMTAMPEMVALFNGFGGMSSLLIGLGQMAVAGAIVAARSSQGGGEATLSFVDALAATGGGDAHFVALTIGLAVLIGGVTFTGSVVAYGKLSEKITGKPVLYTGQQLVNAGAALVAVLLLIVLAVFPGAVWALWLLAGIGLFLGVAAVIPIGGADMPVVISLLNSYSGLAASAAGFAVGSNLLVITGALVGASGLILTRIMCLAMNRSLANVLFSGFGAAGGTEVASAVQGEAKSLTPQEAYVALEAARSVIFVPGYGMAVAQAQHAVKELANLLAANGAEVRFVIHPVAGRMPGHMSVLLAEADVAYEQLVEPPDVNPAMETVDVAVVIGANDVVNPAARDDRTSPLFGMPIIEVDRARACFVLKRSMRSGYAGVENPLFFKPNTSMIFGDAKKTVEGLVAAFKSD